MKPAILPSSFLLLLLAVVLSFSDAKGCTDDPIHIRQLELHHKILSKHGLSSLPNEVITQLRSLKDASFASHQDKPLEKISFASCNNQHLPQPMWKTMEEFNADAFFWLGDAVYLDGSNKLFPFIRYPMPLEHMQQDYNKQQSIDEYCSFRDSLPVFGTWDDHDMGENDADKDYVDKIPAKQMFLDFLGLPTSETIEGLLEKTQTPKSVSSILQKHLLEEAKELRDRDGVYRSRIFGPEGRRVKVILLDIRYHQDRENFDILGPSQWKYLEDELESSYAPYGTEEYRRGGAELVIIGSGIQIVSWGKPITEGWRSFPNSRSRIFRKISSLSSTMSARYYSQKSDTSSNSPRLPPAVLFWSGDVHFAEFSQSYVCDVQPLNPSVPELNTHKTSFNGTSTREQNHALYEGPVWATPLVEVTSSGLTHAWGELPKLSTLPYVGASSSTFFHDFIPRLLKKYITEFDISKPNNVHSLDKSLSKYPLVQKLDRKKLETQGTHSVRLNYATLEFDWDTDPSNPLVLISIRNKEGGAELSYPLPFSTLRPLQVSPIDPSSSQALKDEFSWVSPAVAADVLDLCVAEDTIRQTEGYVIQIVTLGRRISYGLMVILIAIGTWIFMKYSRTVLDKSEKSPSLKTTKED